MDKKYFIITTNGHTASKWIAKVLSRHPQVICSHGAAELSVSLKHDREYTDEEKTKQMDQEYRKKVPLDNILQELESYNESLMVYGNVHMFNLRQLKENMKNNPPVRDITVIDVVRHPVAFVQSGYHNIYSQCLFNPNRVDYVNKVKDWNIDLYERYSKTYALDLESLEVLSFMANVMTFKSFEINFGIHEQDEIHVIPMEDLTGNIESLKSLFAAISGEEIKLTDEEVKEYIDTERSNVHDHTKNKITNQEKYNSWEVWQKELFSEVIHSTGCKERFEKIGYDLSYV